MECPSKRSMMTFASGHGLVAVLRAAAAAAGRADEQLTRLACDVDKLAVGAGHQVARRLAGGTTRLFVIPRLRQARSPTPLIEPSQLEPYLFRTGGTRAMPKSWRCLYGLRFPVLIATAGVSVLARTQI